MQDENQSGVQRRSAVDALSEREASALGKFREDRKAGRDFPIAPVTSAKMFELYLAGRSCEEIQKLNFNFDLGQVVDACVDGDWETRRQAHLDRLLSRVRDRVMQVQAESVEFMGDLLSAAHKLHGDKLRRFIQTGDKSELGDLNIDSLEQYRKAADTLLKLTGQDGNRKIAGEVKHTHTFDPGQKRLSQKEQSELLAELAGEVKGG